MTPRYTLAGRAMPQHDPRAYAFEQSAGDEPFTAEQPSVANDGERRIPDAAPVDFASPFHTGGDRL